MKISHVDYLSEIFEENVTVRNVKQPSPKILETLCPEVKKLGKGKLALCPTCENLLGYEPLIKKKFQKSAIFENLMNFKLEVIKDGVQIFKILCLGCFSCIGLKIVSFNFCFKKISLVNLYWVRDIGKSRNLSFNWK